MNNMHSPLTAMMGEPMFGYTPHLLQEPEGKESSFPGRKRQKTDSTVPKRRPYTRLACFNCRDKHQKCDGQRPACFNCMSKGLECQYREERNKRRCVVYVTRVTSRDNDQGSEEIQSLRSEVEFWQAKYMELKRFVGE
jgi:hypothetical protein